MLTNKDEIFMIIKGFISAYIFNRSFKIRSFLKNRNFIFLNVSIAFIKA